MTTRSGSLPSTAADDAVAALGSAAGSAGIVAASSRSSSSTKVQSAAAAAGSPLDAAPPRRSVLVTIAILPRTCALIAGDTTNGLIPTLKLQVLRDDRGYFPPYDAVPIFRGAVLRRHPSLLPAIDRLTGRLTVAAMQRLNAQVDLEKLPVEAVVRQWRREAGLESGPLRR